MNEVETYTTVLIGIVLGMAIARIVSFIGRIVVRSHYSKLTITHTVWTFGLLLLIVQSWWAMSTDWEFSKADTLIKLTFLLVSPILLYLASAVLCPDIAKDEEFDLDKYHFKANTAFFVIIGLLFVVLIPEAILMNKCGVALFERENIMRLVAALFFFSTPLLIKRWPNIEIAIPIVVVLLIIVQLSWAGPLNLLTECKA